MRTTGELCACALTGLAGFLSEANAAAFFVALRLTPPERRITTLHVFERIERAVTNPLLDAAQVCAWAGARN
jgi:hypothetical protein